MAEIKIDGKLFQERVSHFINAWKSDKRSGDALFGGVSSILIMMGKVEESPEYHKNNAMHFWLLGYEFPTTLMLFTIDTLYILTTAKKAKHLDQIKGGRFPVEVLARGKDAAENAKAFAKITDAIKEAGNKIGVLTKDTAKGPFVDEWKKIFAENCKDVEESDIAQALSAAAFATKDEAELRAMRTSSKACVALMHPFFLDEMSAILDQEKKVKHSSLAEKVEKKLDDDKWWKSVTLPNKQKLPGDFDPEQLDWILGPNVQSGGKYDLRWATEPNNDNLHPGIIISALGLRYRSYCSSIARTFLVDPNKSQESNYKLLHATHQLILKEVRDGAVVKEVYQKALAYIKSKKPELEKHFLKNIGCGIGLEHRDPTMILNAKNSRSLKDGMTLCITSGFSDIENPTPQDKNSKIYSLVIIDTVRVTAAEPVVFTGDAPTDADASSFFFKDEEAQPAPKKEKKEARVGAVATKNITSTRLRSERSTQVDEDAEKRRRDHQKELATKKQKEGLARFAESTNDQDGTEVKKFKRFESYKRDNQLPPKIRDLGIVVDQKNATVIVPVMGRPVPFHIHTIKNASKSDEGDWSFLRINFLSPGQGVGRKDDQPFEDATAHFVRSLTFRSLDGDRYTEIANQIANMKKESAKKEQEKKDMEDVVEQEKLVEIRSKPWVLRLSCATKLMADRGDPRFQIVVRLCWTMSLSAPLWRESVSPARSRFTKTVSVISRLLPLSRGSTSSSPTCGTCSSSPASTNSSSSFTSISRIPFSSGTRRRPRMCSSTAKQPISSSTRLETASASTGTVMRTSSRRSRRSVGVVPNSTDSSRPLPRRLLRRAVRRTLRSTCPCVSSALTVSRSAAMSTSSPQPSVSSSSPSRPSW
ncbi:hypothetical protein RB594_002321 [Gaeumannomyces avenae]